MKVAKILTLFCLFSAPAFSQYTLKDWKLDEQELHLNCSEYKLNYKNGQAYYLFF